MTTQLDVVRSPSQVLTNIINEANRNYGRSKELIVEAYHQALKEDFTPDEAKKLLLERCKIFGKSTIYACLPEESKDQTKASAGRVSHNKGVSVPNLEQKSEVEYEGMGVVDEATGPAGEEIEEEIPDIIDTEKEELKNIVKDKDKAINELRHENEVLALRVGAPDLDTRLQIERLTEEIKKLREENSLLKDNQPAEIQKASEIVSQEKPKEKLVCPFIIKQEEVGKFISVLNKSMTYKTDLQAYLCEGTKLVIQPPLSAAGYITELTRDDIQYLQELLARENAS